MAKGEINIKEERCTGCGFCAHFCARDSISLVRERAVFTNPATCNGCGVCGWMCGGFAIEVFKY